MRCVKLLAARFYRLKSGHAPSRVYLKRFGHRDDDNNCWCQGTVSQTQEHLFNQCSWWREQQKALWKAVGKVTEWKAGRCRHVQVSEQFSIEGCDQAVVDFLAATAVGKFPPKSMAVWSGHRALSSGAGGGGNGFISLYLSICNLSFVSRDEG